MFHFYRVIEGGSEYYCLLHTWKRVCFSNISDIDWLMLEALMVSPKKWLEPLCELGFSLLVLWLKPV